MVASANKILCLPDDICIFVHMTFLIRSPTLNLSHCLSFATAPKYLPQAFK